MRKPFASWALATITFTLVPGALNAQCPLGNATLHGTYVVSGTGTVVGVGSATAVGVHTWDGHGNTVATYTVSVNGNIFPGVTVTGSYSVNPDCTGSIAESDGSHYNFVASPNGNRVTWIQTNTGTVVSGTDIRLRNREEDDAKAQCPLGNATLQGTYAVSGAGIVVGVGSLTAVGVHTWDGHGNTVATYTASVNGNIFPGVTVTGSYSVNPDCTGSLTESDGSHYHFVVSPDGTSATWIRTDAGTVVSGTETRLR